MFSCQTHSEVTECAIHFHTKNPDMGHSCIHTHAHTAGTLLYRCVCLFGSQGFLFSLPLPTHSCAQIKSERTFGCVLQSGSPAVTGTPQGVAEPSPINAENDDISQVCLRYEYNSKLMPDSEQSFNAPKMQNFNEIVDVELRSAVKRMKTTTLPGQERQRW